MSNPASAAAVITLVIADAWVSIHNVLLLGQIL